MPNSIVTEHTPSKRLTLELKLYSMSRELRQMNMYLKNAVKKD